MHTFIVQKLEDNQTKFKMYLMFKDIKALLSRVFRRCAVLDTRTISEIEVFRLKSYLLLEQQEIDKIRWLLYCQAND